MNFDSIYGLILFYVFLVIVICVPAFICYKRAVRSRKYFKCKSCGESYRIENMESSSRCKICGSPVEESDDKNITDKTN